MAKKTKERKVSVTPRKKPNAFTVISVIAVILTYAVFAVYFINGKDRYGLIISALMLAAYICLFIAARIIGYLHSKAEAEKELESRGNIRTKDLPLGVLAELEQPIAVCDTSGDIVWMNKSFSHHGTKPLIADYLPLEDVIDIKGGEFVPEIPIKNEEGVQIDIVTPESFEMPDLLAKMKNEGYSIEAVGTKSFGDNWNIRAYSHTSRGNEYYILVLQCTTEIHEKLQLYDDGLMHVAYIAIDNLEELAQSEQESYRIASTKVDAAIKEWASENSIFIKEYEREKYVMIMSEKSARAVERRQYEILERVSRIKIGSDKLSVTVSIGVSQKLGSLAEKDKQAQNALETALQRGGNQAVIIDEAGKPKFFGAKAITSLKRSGVRHRVFADKLMLRIRECSNVIIMGHRNPDFDAIGSCVGLARLALSVGKKVKIIANPESPTLRECFERLENLPEYRDMFIDATQAQDMLGSNTLVICSDVNNPDNIEAPEVVRNADYLFIIDHHRQSEKTPKPVPEKKEILIVPSASSASELVSEILELELPYNTRLTKEEADIMFAGILLDTKNFTRNAQIPAFGAAIYLRSAGADPVRAQALFKIDLDDYQQETAFSTDIEIYRELAAIAKEGGSDSSPAKRIAAAKTADRLLNVKKIRASFVVTRMLNDVFISARSDGSVNVQLIMEALKGGGHYNAAATMIKECSVDEAVSRLKSSIDAYFASGTNKNN